MMVLNSPSGSGTTTNEGRGAVAAAASVGDEVANSSTTSPTPTSTGTTSMAQKSMLLRRRRLLQQKGAIGGYSAATTATVSSSVSSGSATNSKDGTAPDNGTMNGGTVVARSSPTLSRDKGAEKEDGAGLKTDKVDSKVIGSSSNQGAVKEHVGKGEVPGDKVPSTATASETVESEAAKKKESIQPKEPIEGEDDASVALPPPPLPPARPSYFARLALLCSQNALYMGARTQLSLCPPGRGRKGLQSALQERRRRGKALKGSKIERGGARQPVPDGAKSRVDVDFFTLESVLGEEGILAYDAEEEKFLADPDAVDRETNTDGEEIVEDPSSGDEDELDVNLDEDETNTGGAGGAGPKPSSSALADVGGTAVVAHTDDDAYVHREPLYTPAGAEGIVAPGVAGVPGVGTGGAMGSAAFGKLPFNHRKLRWFDSVTAADRAAARQYLREQMTALKKRDLEELTSHLKKVQRRDRRRMHRARGQGSTASATAPTDACSDEDEAEDAKLEIAASSLGVSSLPSNMTPSLSAALVLESLSLNALESLEGVAKCYDGIVAAGTALLEADISDDASTIASSAVPDRLDQQAEKASKAEIMAALIPLLITALEQPSGETILTLAKLRRMCGTRRYQRRFVQRIAPCLVRPPNGAQWCLRHQNDMEPILAATELILDNAFEIFASGWYERGQTLVEDTQRAETLRTAADQLKRLSSVQAEGSLFNINLMSSTGATGGRRTTAAAAARIIGAAAAGAKEGNGVGSSAGAGGNGAGSSAGDSLAEWEILAVDRQIRESIRSLFTKDWTKIAQPSVAPPRDDVSVGSTSSRRSRGISASKGQKPSTPTAGGQPGGEDLDSVGAVGAIASPPPAPPESPTTSNQQGTPPPSAPLSPRSQLNKVPLPLSPQPTVTPPAQSSPPSLQPSPAVLESVFGPSFASEQVLSSQGISPTKSASPSPPPPGSPPAVGRTGTPVFRPGVDDIGDQTPIGGRRSLQNSSPQPVSTAITPPQTPKQIASPPRPGTPPIASSPSSSARGDLTNAVLGDNVAANRSDGREKRDEGKTHDPSPSGGELVGEWSKAAIVPSGSQTPLSPSSVASGGSHASDAPTSRSTIMAPSSPGVGSAAGSGATVSQQSSHSAYLRTLTSTAAERKRTVAACRALRAQIIRFEEAFVQLHGRPPKGAAERAPLATTYAQYREWKRAIRADAACRIQALMRGARVRLLLMGTGNPDVQRIITARHSRKRDALDSDQQQQTTGKDGATISSQMNSGRLVLPIEMGPDGSGAPKPQSSFASEPHEAKQPPRNRTSLMPRSSGAPVSDEGENDGVEVIISPTGAGQLSPTSPSAGWTATPSSSLPPRRSTVSMSKDGGGRSASSAVPTEAVPGMPILNIEEMSMAELSASKRELKQQLKQYDMNFARQHGRMPVKAEKEPIRHLYENYNALKSRITFLEQQQNAGGQQRPMGSTTPSSPQASQQNSSELQMAAVASSPASSSVTGNVRRSSSPPMTFSETSSAEESVGGVSTPPTTIARKRRENRIHSAPPMNHLTSGELPGNSTSPPLHGSTSGGSNGNGGTSGGNGVSSLPASSSSAAAAGGSPVTSQSQDTLQSLKAEKGTLHQMLRSYEKDFFKMHNRQVSSFADIRPVASQYRRYKEIKRAIAALQQGGDR